MHTNLLCQRRILALPLPRRANRGEFAYRFNPGNPGMLRFLCGILLISLSLTAVSDSTEAPEPQNRSANQTLTQSALDQQIKQVLQNPEFSWREPSAPPQQSKQKSTIERWMISLRQVVLSFGDWASRLFRSLFKPFDLKPSHFPLASPGASRLSELLNALGYLLWAAFAGTLILLVVRVLKLKPTRLPPSTVSRQKPDLGSDQIEAHQLPDHEWYALAREKMAAGDFRQAQRALFLAILSCLASHRFITLERWKSNSDYEKELGRKAKHRFELPALFAQSRLGFERCWYGPDSVSPEDFDRYHSIYQKIKHAAN